MKSPLHYVGLAKPLSREQSREVDRVAIEQFGMSGLVLMENAGRNAAAAIVTIADHSCEDIAILCGPGNNGGDGYVIARHLDAAGYAVTVFTLVDPEQLKGDARHNYLIAARAAIPVRLLRNANEIGTPSLIVDCLLGTGASGPPKEAYAAAIQYANQLSSTRVAIDLPSGLDCDTGIPQTPTFHAHYTLTFVARKRGFDSPQAAPCLGQVCVLPIGVPRKLLEAFASNHASLTHP